MAEVLDIVQLLIFVTANLALSSSFPILPEIETMSAEARLLELGVTLPAAPAAVGAYVPAVKQGNLVVTSGQLPMQNGTIVYAGKLGPTSTLRQAKKRHGCAL